MFSCDEIEKRFPRLHFSEDARTRLREVLDFLAKRADQELADKFFKRLKYLNGYAGERSKGCKLGRDHSPLSFSFAMLGPSGQFWFDGGLIYNSAGGWSLHT